MRNVFKLVLTALIALAAMIIGVTLIWILGFKTAAGSSITAVIDWVFPLSAILLYLALPAGRSVFAAVSVQSVIKPLLIWCAGSVILWLFLRFLFYGNIDGLSPALAVAIGFALLVLTLLVRILMSGPYLSISTLLTLPVFLLLYPKMIPSTQVWFSGLFSDATDWEHSLSSLLADGRGVMLMFLAATTTAYLLIMRHGTSNWSTPLRTVLSRLLWVVTVMLLWFLGVFALNLTGEISREVLLLIGATLAFLSLVPPAIYLYLTGQLDFFTMAQDPVYREDENRQVHLTRGTQRGKKNAWIISYTGVSNEPRVLRQCKALLDDGWEVVVCGYDGHSERPKEWHFVKLPDSASYHARVSWLLRIIRGISHRLLIHGRPRFMFRWAAHLMRATIPNWSYARHSLIRLAKENRDLAPNLVVAHDYFSADTGMAIARLYKAKFAIDCHEYSPGQYPNNPHWMKYDKPYVDVIHKYYLEKADQVTTVCDGIADHLNKENNLKRPVEVIKSVPFKNIQPYRPVGKRIKVLYHGDLSERREIHTAIASMVDWRDDIDLTLRGNGDEAYLSKLKTIVSRKGLSDRVTFEPNVPFDRIIPEANQADIGYFSFLDQSPQIRFTLPNKFFEYVMAGLAICVTDLPEVGRIVDQYKLGKLIPKHTIKDISETVNSFTHEEINAYKKASLTAADELNWESEQDKMIAVYERLGPWY